MEKDKIIKSAKLLFNHRLNKSGLKNLPKNLQPNSIEEAYEIQKELKLFYLNLSRNYTLGKKVGCTNKIAQEQVGIYEPFYGNLFSRFCDFTGCTLKSKNFFRPFIEPEISFRLKNDINPNLAPFKINQSSLIFDKMLPSIEIVDFRFGTEIKKVGIKNLISTNGASEFWIRSDKLYSLDYIDLNDNKVELLINNKLIEVGNTKNVLNNPLNSAIWLVNKIITSGEPLLKGQFISTGTCTKAVPIFENNFIKADFGKIGCIEFTYS